jgi:hypothetical protein
VAGNATRYRSGEMTAWIETKVFDKLFSDLGKAGWTPTHIDTGDEQEWVKVASIKEARTEFESVDEATIRVAKEGTTPKRIFLVAGNGIDLICDYSFSEGDADGFSALMDQITDRIYATYDR